MNQKTDSRWQFWIDRGGTFTDVVAQDPDGNLLTHKLLSENPEQYLDAALAAIRHFLGIKPGETTADGQFTLTTVECLASCGTAPMMMVGDAFFENLTPASVDALLTELQETP